MSWAAPRAMFVCCCQGSACEQSWSPGICPPPGLSAETGPSFPGSCAWLWWACDFSALSSGAGTEPWITSDDGHECCLCRCSLVRQGAPCSNSPRALFCRLQTSVLMKVLLAPCPSFYAHGCVPCWSRLSVLIALSPRDDVCHDAQRVITSLSMLLVASQSVPLLPCREQGCHNGRVKPDKNQRAIVKSMSAWACFACAPAFRHARMMAIPASEVKHSFSICYWHSSPCVLKKQVVSTPSSRFCRRSTVVCQSHRQASPTYPALHCATWTR